MKTMWARLLFVSLAAIFVSALKVPFENTPDGITKTVTNPQQIQNLPIYYISDEANVDHLVPSDFEKPEQFGSDVATPATYLLPPSPESQNQYYTKPTEPGEQTDWYPIAIPQKDTEIVPLFQQEVKPDLNEPRKDFRTGKTLLRSQSISVPSRNLLPPSENAPDNFIMLSPSVELELPSINHNLNEDKIVHHPILRPPLEKPHPLHFKVKPQSPVPFITPPKSKQEYNNPTRLYPKKYNEFKPLPIPVPVYGYETEDQPVKPVQDLEPFQHTESEYRMPMNDKKNYIYEQSHKKRKLKHQKEAEKLPAATGDVFDDVIPTEQEASESNQRYPGRHIDPNQLRHEPVKNKPDLKSKGERTEFRMHGMNGPHSYQFGFDTGKGKNRQFRYEERDNDGNVKGHYGYVDKFGKLRVVNYNADPEHGFRAEAPVVTD